MPFVDLRGRSGSIVRGGAKRLDLLPDWLGARVLARQLAWGLSGRQGDLGRFFLRIEHGVQRPERFFESDSGLEILRPARDRPIVDIDVGNRLARAGPDFVEGEAVGLEPVGDHLSQHLRPIAHPQRSVAAACVDNDLHAPGQFPRERDGAGNRGTKMVNPLPTFAP